MILVGNPPLLPEKKASLTLLSRLELDDDPKYRINPPPKP